jgi:hypothetical protein
VIFGGYNPVVFLSGDAVMGRHFIILKKLEKMASSPQ